MLMEMNLLNLKLNKSINFLELKMKIFIIITVLLLFSSQIYANEIPNIHRANIFTYGGLPVTQNVTEMQLILAMDL